MGVTAGGLVLPKEVKSELIKPFAELISRNGLDEEIRNRIVALKKDNQNLQFGELHCHSYYSDGAYSVKDLMLRSASLGLAPSDFAYVHSGFYLYGTVQPACTRYHDGSAWL